MRSAESANRGSAGGGRLSIAASAAIATQPKTEQARILAMPKDELREAVRDIRNNKAEREAAEKRDRDLSFYSDLYDSVQFLSRYYEDAEDAWAGITGVCGYDFADLLPRAIQALVRIEKGNPNEMSQVATFVPAGLHYRRNVSNC
jgi:hypothetical protein